MTTLPPEQEGETPDRADRWAYWRRVSAGMPPLSADEISTVGLILRRIDQHDEPNPDHEK
ncbi:hypothetical protein A8924_6342 [Saccharopolyspora erythraea NRRL 2338]|uniref:Uncharacterized protein n=1 Tax=Saccharopolyspora erythraea TaxID=1836 RepID=A0ABP3LVE3_SACER|nr:hypothetical protein [Saccharopolyspora erythraea]EQD87816.1 hypothetical protein N599_02460 [Saccharopolyspora erythraea D]PFG98816.1 hypothetical protein A8924_6342 [Saccharopolyspora erythraea NRRL 2338]QRK88813.1 hypothetical protein JQX30_30045 [Saccharopolyspora erythraea]